MSGFNPLSALSGSSAFIQRQLKTNQSALDTSLERLSSGLRINRAADDPIGITLANRGQTQLRSNRAAIDQNMQAINLADVAAGGAQQVLGQLQRLRELTVTSLNDTTSADERSRLQGEISTIVRSVGQTVDATRFNSRQLLDGSSAGFQNFARASGEFVSNFTYTSETTGNVFNFLDSFSVDPSVNVNDTFTFRTSLNSSTNKYTLEVLSARSGLLLTYNDLDASPGSFTFSLPTTSGSGNITINRAPFDFERITGPLTAAELNKPLEQLVNNDRLDPITYGTLQVQLGPNTHSINVNGGMTLQNLLTSINSLSSGSNTVTAAYNSGTGKIQLNYTGQADSTTSQVTTYTIPAPAAAGGPYATYAAMPAPAQGPSYRNITLPATGYSVGSPPANFPASPAALNTSVSFTGTNSSITSAFGLANAGNLGTVSAYSSTYYGETVATANPNEYVNRTRIVIGSLTATQNLDGSNTGLTAADSTKSFAVLNTAKVTAAPLSAGDFTINLGSNGTFTFTGFNPNTNTIQDIVTAINAYTGETIGGNVTASYDEPNDILQITNSVIVGDNSINFGGTNGSAVAAFFKLNNATSTGIGLQSTQSTAAIDNGGTDASLELTAADVAGTSLNALRTPKLSTLVQGQLTINGQNVINLTTSNTITNLVDAITNFAASGNRDYTASFDGAVSRGLRINTIDIETLANASTQPAASPSAASATLTANQLTLDSAAYLANGAPPYQQATYSATPLTPNAANTPYVTSTPTAPANVAGISFGGTTNIASVLFLNSAANGAVSVVGDQFQGTAVSTGHSTFQLTGNQRRTFQANSSTESTQRLGYDTSSIDVADLPDYGIIGEVRIKPQTLSRTQDRALNLIVDGEKGGALRLSIDDLSPRALRLEGLQVYRDGDSDLQARIRGNNALTIIDRAIDSTLDTISRVGSGQRVLESNLDRLESRQVQLSDTLSDLQDADLTTEISNMTRAQLNIQAGASVLSQRQSDARTLFGLLFDFGREV